VKIGQRLVIRKGPVSFEIDIEGLSEQRGPASVAQTLYQETEQSIKAREQQRLEMRSAAAALPRPEHRPERRNRRALAAFKRGRDS